MDAKTKEKDKIRHRERRKIESDYNKNTEGCKRRQEKYNLKNKEKIREYLKIRYNVIKIMGGEFN